MSGSPDYLDLLAGRKSVELVESICCCTRSIPREKLCGIMSQMRKAGASVPCNIAEGQAGNAPWEFRYFLGIIR